ncbi:MAG TPA: sigma-70 family RNA polymerase sigma factor, partial [Thermoleophilaceae bacterium]|nr:sigma-70 family RNA polymerase sigma factor [Thermoleophilaceae bacterium]
MTPRALFHPARLARRPVLSTQSDERLVDLVRAGSDPAFEAIVERYRRALMRHVSRLLPAERAEDVVQQAFVNAYEAMHRGAAELNLRPWLYRIAHNVALNALRDRALGHAQLDEQIDGVERPDQAFERVTGLRELVVAVQALPERQRSAILLRELEGRSYEEIGAALGVTDGAVRQLLNRARNTLRAAAAAITPMPLLTRVASGESADSLSARVGELVGVGGGALAMKVCATALVTGAVVGGVAVVPGSGRNDHSVAPLAAETAQAADDSGHDGPSLTMRASAGNAGTRADVAEHGERHAAERSSRRGSAPGEPGDERRGGSRESGDDDGGDDGSSDDGERHRREGGSGGGGDGSSGDDSPDDPSGSGSDGPEL